MSNVFPVGFIMIISTIQALNFSDKNLGFQNLLRYILTESSEYFRDMFIPKNLPHLKDIDVTYIIDFDFDLKDPEVWGFRWMPLESSGAEKLLEKLYLNDELSDVNIYINSFWVERAKSSKICHLTPKWWKQLLGKSKLLTHLPM